MKILAIIPDAFGGHGGIALYMRNMLTALAEHSAKPEIFALPRVMPFPPGEIPPRIRWDVRGLGGKLKYGLASLNLARKHRDVDLIVCGHIHLLPFAWLARALSGAPIVLFVYGIEVRKPTTKRSANALVRKVSAVISIRTHTTAALDRWANTSQVPRYLLENAIALSAYGAKTKNPVLVAKYGLAGKRVLLTFGRLDEHEKGFDEILEVLPKLLERFPDLVYVIAGGGPDVGRLKEKARKTGVFEHVVFTGLVPDAEKADYFRLADVYAMPGRGQHFDRYPLRFVFLEAMACGIPVVGATPEREEERLKDGALLTQQVDPNDPADIVRGISVALENPTRKVPDALRRFSYENFRTELHRIVDDVFNHRGAS